MLDCACVGAVKQACDQCISSQTWVWRCQLEAITGLSNSRTSLLIQFLHSLFALW